MSRSRGRKRDGTCRLCGVVGPLSFEHVPPRAAFNQDTVLIQSGLAALQSHPDNVRGRAQQGGFGAFTLCGRCNNLTGREYAPSYVNWAKQGHCVLDQRGADLTRTATFRIRPLRVLKQVVCMFFSANPPALRREAPELAQFVIDPGRREFNPAHKVYVFLNSGKRMRMAGATVSSNVHGGEIRVLSEVTFRPFGYVLTLEAARPEPGLCNINWFAEVCGDEEWTGEISIPVIPIYSRYPGDFRSRATVLAEAAQSAAGGAESVAPSPDRLLDQMDRATAIARRWQRP